MMKARQSYRPYRSFCALLSLIVVSSLSQMASAQCDAFAGIAPEDPVNICGTEPFCLVDYLETDGTPIQTDGVWTGPSDWTWDATLCASFDPSAHPTGDYTYTVVGTDGCIDSATISMDFANDGIVDYITHCFGGSYDLFAEIAGPDEIPLSGNWYYPGPTGYPSIGSEVPDGIIDTEVDPEGTYVYQYYDANNCFTTAGAYIIFETGGTTGCETTVEYTFGLGGFCPFEHLECDPTPGGSWIVWDANGNVLDFYPDFFECVSDYEILSLGESIRFEYILGTAPCALAFTDLHLNVQGFDSNALITDILACVSSGLIDPSELVDDPNIENEESLIWTYAQVNGALPELSLPLDLGLYEPGSTLVLQYTELQDDDIQTIGFLSIQIESESTAGQDVVVPTLCEDGSSIDLNSFLHDSATPGGYWLNPSGIEVSGGIVQSMIANSGFYTYLIEGLECPTDEAEYTISFAPEITYTVNATCEPNQTEYYVELEVLTGEYIEIIDNGNGLLVQPAQEGVHMLGPIPVGVNFSFTIVSANSCPDVVVSGISPDCVCPASGTITSANETICEGECFDLVIEFEGSPTYDFTYFDGAGSYSVSNFFGDSYTLQVCPTINTTYTLVDMNDANCTGEASGSVTVNVETPPNAGADSATEFCADGSFIQFPPPFDSDPGGIWSPSGEVLADEGNSGVYTYTVPGTACPSDVSEHEMTFQPEITYTVQETCLGIESQYVLEIFVTSGDVVSVGMGSGVLSGDVFTSDPIQVGTPYSFELISGNACPSVLVSGDGPSCECETAGAISNTEETLCIGNCTDLIFELEGIPPFDVIYTDGDNDFSLSGIQNGHILTACPNENTTYSLISVTDQSCEAESTSTATVQIEIPPNAGPDSAVELCEDQSLIVDLNQYLDLMADVGGTFNLNWFSQIPDNSGQYVYVVSGFNCPSDSAEYLVEIEPDTDGDGICDSDEIVGCQNPSAANYNPLATDPGPCELDGGYEDVLTDLVQQSGELSDGISGISLGAKDSESSTFKIYPNPARDFFLLQPTSVSITEVIVMSPGGKVVGIVFPRNRR